MRFRIRMGRTSSAVVAIVLIAIFFPDMEEEGYRILASLTKALI